MVTGAVALPRAGPLAMFGGGVGDGEGAGRPTPPKATRLPPRSSAPASAAARYPRATAGLRPRPIVAGGAPRGAPGSVATKSNDSGSASPAGGAPAPGRPGRPAAGRRRRE